MDKIIFELYNEYQDAQIGHEAPILDTITKFDPSRKVDQTQLQQPNKKRYQKRG